MQIDWVKKLGATSINCKSTAVGTPYCDVIWYTVLTLLIKNESMSLEVKYRVHGLCMNSYTVNSFIVVTLLDIPEICLTLLRQGC